MRTCTVHQKAVVSNACSITTTTGGDQGGGVVGCMGVVGWGNSESSMNSRESIIQGYG